MSIDQEHKAAVMMQPKIEVISKALEIGIITRAEARELFKCSDSLQKLSEILEADLQETK